MKLIHIDQFCNIEMWKNRQKSEEKLNKKITKINWIWLGKFSLFPQSSKKFESWAEKPEKRKKQTIKQHKFQFEIVIGKKLFMIFFYRFLLESKLSFFILNYVFTNFSLQCDLISGCIWQKQSSALPCSFQFLIWGYEKDFASFSTFFTSLFSRLISFPFTAFVDVEARKKELRKANLIRWANFQWINFWRNYFLILFWKKNVAVPFCVSSNK